MFIPTSSAFAKEYKEHKDFSSFTLVNTKTYTIGDVEYEEYFYKPSSKVNGQDANTLSVTPYIITPEEGDFNIVIQKGALSGKDWFATVTGYKNYLQYTGIYNFASTATGLISNPILAYFTGAGLTGIYNGLKGSGTAYSVERTVVKWGQIYHNGSWVDYYHGTQKEVFWGQMTYVYAADGSVIYSKNDDFNESKGYCPIYVNATSKFRDNNQVYQYALGAYNVNGYWYGDSGSVVLKTSAWQVGISPNY